MPLQCGRGRAQGREERSSGGGSPDAVAWRMRRYDLGMPWEDDSPHAPTTPAPGRRTLTMSLAPRAVQRKGMSISAGELGHEPHADVGALVADATADAGETLPHLSTVQERFGRHDLSSVRAHVGPRVERAATALGAQAFAAGEHVAFARPPSLHTVMHETAHVIQQRGAGVVPQGLGAADDVHERHADDVADRAVRGESVEARFERYAPLRAGHGASVQLMTVRGNETRWNEAKAQGERALIERLSRGFDTDRDLSDADRTMLLDLMNRGLFGLSTPVRHEQLLDELTPEPDEEPGEEPGEDPDADPRKRKRVPSDDEPSDDDQKGRKGRKDKKDKEKKDRAPRKKPKRESARGANQNAGGQDDSDDQGSGPEDGGDDMEQEGGASKGKDADLDAFLRAMAESPTPDDQPAVQAEQKAQAANASSSNADPSQSLPKRRRAAQPKTKDEQELPLDQHILAHLNAEIEKLNTTNVDKSKELQALSRLATQIDAAVSGATCVAVMVSGNTIVIAANKAGPATATNAAHMLGAIQTGNVDTPLSAQTPLAATYGNQVHQGSTRNLESKTATGLATKNVAAEHNFGRNSHPNKKQLAVLEQIARRRLEATKQWMQERGIERIVVHRGADNEKHAEMRLLDALHAYLQGNNANLRFDLGITKTCCALCYLAVQLFRELHPNVTLGVQGTHRKTFAKWPLPHFVAANLDRFAQLKKDASPKDRATAVEKIQNFKRKDKRPRKTKKGDQGAHDKSAVTRADTAYHSDGESGASNAAPDRSESKHPKRAKGSSSNSNNANGTGGDQFEQDFEDGAGEGDLAEEVEEDEMLVDSGDRSKPKRRSGPNPNAQDSDPEQEGTT
jgi:hypothetical protein